MTDDATQAALYPPPGKTAIVTGGSSGIGRQTAVALASAGWNVMVTGRRVPELEQTVKLIHEAGAGKAKGDFSTDDITKEEGIKRLFETTASRFGNISLVFCNAGISPPSVPITEQKVSDWQATLDINLTAPYLCSRAAFEHMSRQKPQGGRIVINGSISAHTPRPYSTAYTATKHAMTGLTKSLSLDGRAHDIAVTQIDIGNAASDMTTKMTTGPGTMQADLSFKREPTMDSSWAAKQIVNIAEMPLEVNVPFVTIQATKMPSFVGRG